jgi:tetratricopeptide (TPR) repeat protein
VLVEKLPRILEYPNGSIQTTWTMSFNDIKAKDESASKLLELFAFYDNHDIWLNLLRSGDPDFPCPLWFQEIVKSPVVLLEKFKLLLDYSMIQQTVEVESYSMHSVVHEWLGWISERNKAELARIAIITVAFASPGHEEDGYWSAQKRLLPHSGHLLKYMVGKDRVSIAALPMPRADSNSSTPYPLKTAGPHMEHPLVRICQLYSDQELFDIGKSIIQAAVVQFEMEVGTHHPITVWSIALLAQFNANLRQYQDAEELSQRALDGFDKLFGSNNTMSMEVLIDLINIYIDERKLTDAKKLAEELQARGIGSDDRLSTYFLNTLGIMYWETGDQEKSIAANLKSLERSEKEFGPHNRHTLGIVSNLAKHYRGCKMFQESECMFNRALEGYKDIFGLEHRNTADIIYNLGMLYSEMGESAKAESLLRQSIPILEAFYGEESRQTTRIKYDLGLEYLRQGKIDEAEEIFECILPHCKHIFGQDDEQTQGVVSFLGATYLGNGRLDEALDMAHQNIEGCERIYGGDSPATQSAYLDLGTILMVQGNLGEAERAFCRVTECCLPSDSSNRHPTAISAAQGLAATLHLQCMNEYKDFQLESKKHQPGLKSFPVPSHQILGLTKLLQKYGSSEWQVFTCLGQVLKRFVGDTDARIAYQQQAIRKDGILRYTGWRCDGCGTDILRERFVCVGCEDVDFCKKCSNQYKKGKLEVKDCKGHDLFDVSLPSKLGFKKSIVCGEASGQEWLASLLAKYGGSE